MDGWWWWCVWGGVRTAKATMNLVRIGDFPDAARIRCQTHRAPISTTFLQITRLFGLLGSPRRCFPGTLAANQLYSRGEYGEWVLLW